MESQQTESLTREDSSGNVVDYEAMYRELLIEHGKLKARFFDLEHAFRFLASSIKWEIFENRVRLKAKTLLQKGVLDREVMIGPDYRELYPSEKSRYIMEFMKVTQCQSNIAINSANMQLVRKDDFKYDPVKAVHENVGVPEEG